MSEYNKYKSRRFLISLWALIMVTVMILFSLIKSFEPSYFATTLPVFLGVILSFVGIESWKKNRSEK